MQIHCDPKMLKWLGREKTVCLIHERSSHMQKWGKPAREICLGDVVSVLLGEKQWRGAAPTTAMNSNRHPGIPGWQGR